MKSASDRPKVLSKTELQERLWPGTFVVEAKLSNLVAGIREAPMTPPVRPLIQPIAIARWHKV
jgi:hypothetical protein